MSRRRAAGALAAIAVVLAGCGSSGKPNALAEAVSKAAPVVGARVQADAAGFSPLTITLKAGQAVGFTNADTIERHYVAKDSAGTTAMDSGAQQPGEQFTWRPGATGTFTVTDSARAGVTLTVKVKPG
jgi:plastocyanin